MFKPGAKAAVKAEQELFPSEGARKYKHDYTSLSAYRSMTSSRQNNLKSMDFDLFPKLNLSNAGYTVGSYRNLEAEMILGRQRDAEARHRAER